LVGNCRRDGFLSGQDYAKEIFNPGSRASPQRIVTPLGILRHWVMITVNPKRIKTTV